MVNVNIYLERVFDFGQGILFFFDHSLLYMLRKTAEETNKQNEWVCGISIRNDVNRTRDSNRLNWPLNQQ